MRAVIQRVTAAAVKVDGETIGSCKKGLCILLGVAEGDTEAEADMLLRKILQLRIFRDGNGKMNLSLLDTGGELLIISQFTLLANCRHGNRPDFLLSAKPEEAKRLYLYFIEAARRQVASVGEGSFGADMEVTLSNDGPVTIVLDTDTLKAKG
ncbi:MAG: D-tyrosyl-tRNA(Tyr) deacylase [Clostridia bacterium]|nr:D-tyrosyl-tRNA(Tyr) deacylase [Clostridia bacterium]